MDRFGLTPDEWTAIGLSLRVAVAATAVSLVPGLAVAWVLARKRFPGRALLDGLVHLPLILPPVVTGYLLLLALGRRGWFGPALAEIGIVFSFRWTGAALACAVMGFPLMVRAMRLSIEAVDRGVEQAAATLGASPAAVFLTVTLPLALPGVLAGAVLAFAKAMGEFGATITFVSNIPGETQTLPSAIYTLTQVPGGEGGALRLTLISVALSMGALLVSEVLARRLGRRLGLGADMTILVDVALARDAFTLDVAFTAPAGLTALFGRSGSGKTTVIDLIAGLARPDRGRIVLDGEVVLDTAARREVPTHRRRIGTVFQQARLMPHLSVRQNLGYGRWFAGRRADASGLGFDDVVGLLGIDHLLDRRPAGLSGGEGQRVAIGRALLSRPRLLLMDEPLAALDAARKAEILPLIERLRDHAGIPIVYVSHAVSEVARLAGTIVVLEAGRVTAAGPAETILRRGELGPFHEAEAGALLDMMVEADDAATGLTRLVGRAGRLVVPHLARATGTAVRVRVPARDVIVSLGVPAGLSARNILPGRVLAVRPLGDSAALVEIDCNGAVLSARLTRASVEALALAPGRPVHAIVKSVAFDPLGVGTGWAGAAVEI